MMKVRYPVYQKGKFHEFVKVDLKSPVGKRQIGLLNLHYMGEFDVRNPEFLFGITDDGTEVYTNDIIYNSQEYVMKIEYGEMEWFISPMEPERYLGWFFRYEDGCCEQIDLRDLPKMVVAGNIHTHPYLWTLDEMFAKYGWITNGAHAYILDDKNVVAVKVDDVNWDGKEAYISSVDDNVVYKWIPFCDIFQTEKECNTSK
jgi:hypothetical protein